MEPTSIALVCVGLIVAGIVKGATGLGYASCALPFLVMAVGLKPAMGLVIAPALATNFSLAFSTGHFRETISKFRILYASMLPGIAVGLWLLSWVEQGAAVRVLGVVIVFYVVLALARPTLTLPQALVIPLQWPTGFLNGVVAGVTGAQVMPLFPYIMALRLEPDRTVQAVNMAVMIASTVLGAGLLVSGQMSPLNAALSFAAIIPALIGVELGTRARGMIPASKFRVVALLTLATLGILMLLRSASL